MQLALFRTAENPIYVTLHILSFKAPLLHIMLPGLDSGQDVLLMCLYFIQF